MCQGYNSPFYVITNTLGPTFENSHTCVLTTVRPFSSSPDLPWSPRHDKETSRTELLQTPCSPFLPLRQNIGGPRVGPWILFHRPLPNHTPPPSTRLQNPSLPVSSKSQLFWFQEIQPFFVYHLTLHTSPSPFNLCKR